MQSNFNSLQKKGGAKMLESIFDEIVILGTAC